MKVLKPGRPQQGWSTKRKCTGAGNHGGGCGATLLVEEGDLYTTFSSHYDGSTDIYVTFRCVACQVETDIPWEDLPSHLMGSLPSKAKWEEMHPPLPVKGLGE